MVERFHDDFADDLSTALRYYDAIDLGLGDRFREAVRGRLQTIKQRPESFGFLERPLRFANVGSFPYVIVFEYDAPVIFFGGIYHAMSDPAGWTERPNPYRHG